MSPTTVPHPIQSLARLAIHRQRALGVLAAGLGAVSRRLRSVAPERWLLAVLGLLLLAFLVALLLGPTVGRGGR